MATIERIEPAYTPWSPSKAGFPAAVGDKEYTGRHRRPGTHGLRLLRMFYSGKHRRA
ncbi:MAG: hypothetical protein ACRDVG_17370 [Jatrophihabitantaceae bacterium]